MIVYEATAKKFIEDVDSNQILAEIEKAFREKLGRGIPPSEVSAYSNSLPHMERVVRRSGVADDCGILIEYKIPLTNFRIDFVISGQDEHGNKNFVIVELKQWQKANVVEGDGLVETFTGRNNRIVTHPSYQASRYKEFMSDFNEVIYSDSVKAYSCAYLHNYEECDPEPLLDDRYADIISTSPLYFRDDQQKLQDFIAKYVKYGKGSEILYEINNGKIKPSKKLIEHVAGMFNGNSNFILLDEQKVVFEFARTVAKKQKKAVVIVKGGPGTGKSVVSVNLVSKLLKDNLNTIFVAPNSSFRNSIVKMLAQNKTPARIRNIFKGSASFYDSAADEFDVLVVDEAHRLKGEGAFMYKGSNQVDDVINAAKVSIFFIDDNQIVRPDDIGSVEHLKNLAEKFDAEIYEFELSTQFRCSGAEGYINWLDDILEIKETGNYDGWDKKDFDFKVFDNPTHLKNALEEKALEGKSARILAGYAWNWTSIKEGNDHAQVFDICMPEYDFSMPWNSRKVGTTWAIDEEGIGQIGCIHTSQGLEFDYVGVIVGADLSYNSESQKYFTDYDKYKDKVGKKNLKDSPEKLNTLVRNIYKVLMTRGMKGCYVYFVDKEVEKYFKQHISSQNSSQKNVKLEKPAPSELVASPYAGEMVAIPLYDSIGCGELMLADSNSDESIEVPAWLIKPGAKYFALHTRGDSMNQLGINEGDIILCQKNLNANTGNAVVLIGDDATLKQIKVERDGLVLIPKSTNPEHRIRKLTADDEFKILGVFVCKIDIER